VQRFARSGPAGRWQAETALRIQTLDDWLTQREQDVWVSGPGLHIHGGRLPTHIPVARAEAWDPQPESLLQIGLARYRAGDRDNLWAVEPLYLRLSAAEEQWQARLTPSR
jgi:tRNA threonylcarbamoyladenosine biosynthesis protein TsaB